VVAEFVDDGRGLLVLLLLGGEPLAFVENQVLLIALPFAFPWFRNGRDELGLAPGFDDLLRRLALVIKLPVALRVLIGRVENRPLEELVFHIWRPARRLLASPLGQPAR